MALSKYKLGDLMEQSDKRNSDNKYTLNNIKGISIQKVFIQTKADMKDVSLTPYKIVEPDDFAYVTVTSRNGEKITLAHNSTECTYIVSSSYIVFRVKRTDLLNSDYLFMYFNRPEFDRYSRFNSWGSARETFSWEDLCEMEIDLPSLSIQQKYVDIYKAMIKNQQSYERGLDDLKLTCDAFIEDLRKTLHCERIGRLLQIVDEKNDNMQFGINSVMGVSIEKKFIPTKANMADVNLKPYYVVNPNEFAFVPVTSRNGEKISLAMNDSNNTYICSSSYVVFKSANENSLCPEYLMLFLSRSEFDRYARFNSWGSARETFNFEDMCNVEIPIPDISVQQSIADIYSVYIRRKQINEQLKAQIKNICPVLIKGAMEEGENS